MSPVWDSEIIYDEFLTMVKSDGVIEAPLLFEPTEIMSVTSADKTMTYDRGTDWEIRGNIFSLTGTSRIFYFEENALIFDKYKHEESFKTVDGRYSLFKEGHFFHDRQICVTYRRKKQTKDFTQNFCGNLLPRTLKKLSGKENIKMVLYGDSIAAGANSSGMTLTTPYLPRWGNLFVENLKRHYDTKIELVNTSVGCKDSYWGMENAQKRVAEYFPDLAMIAFGMNDKDRGDVFAQNIKKIMESILEISPNTEFILCATTVPNKSVEGFYFYQDEHAKYLYELEREGVAIADFYHMQMYLLEKKRFIDMTGNNLNHPNDFLIRCHAQLLSAMLIDSDAKCKEEPQV